jgi:catechol 2,3-dioxygenase-like lactoylglutathione lyase family enzyme
MGEARSPAFASSSFRVERLDHIVLTVADLEASVSFYETVCGMQRASFDGGRVAMVFGAQKLNLNQRTPDGPSSEPLDFCLVTSWSSDEVVGHLRRNGVAVRLGPVGRSGALGEMTSVYVLDPDDNIVEIASYGSASAPARKIASRV